MMSFFFLFSFSLHLLVFIFSNMFVRDESDCITSTRIKVLSFLFDESR